MKNLKTFELFGWSKAEKSDKQKSQDIEALKKEVLNYNWLRLTAQPNKDTTYEYLVQLRLQSAKEELPILYKMLPKLWDKQTNARCYVNYDGEDVEMIVPNNFHFIIDNTGHVVDSDENKKRILDRILEKL